MMEEENDTASCSSRASEAVATTTAASRNRRRKLEVYHEVLRRLRESGCDDAARPGFDEELWAHFNRLPVRYALDVNVERAQDVLIHKKLLQLAHDPATRPAFDARIIQAHPVVNENHDNSATATTLEKDTKYFGSIRPPVAFGLSSNLELAIGTNKSHVFGNSSKRASRDLSRRLHEVTISTTDKPKLLCKLTSLLSDIGLNIQEAHAFSTADGYSLDVFVVDGGEYEKTEQLRDVLAKEIPWIEKLPISKQSPVAPNEQLSQMEICHECLQVPVDRFDVWEIDVKLLTFEQKIAGGTYRDLYKGSFHGHLVAIKVLKAEHLNDTVQREFTQEVFIMRKVRHKNVVQFIGSCTKPPNLCIVTEFMAGGSVYDYLHKKKGRFNIAAILKVALDVSKGMNYLHQNNIVHRDLKAANLLMDENGVVKVADFGVARLQSQSGVMTAETGTYRWMAPEVIEHRPYNHKADVFSFGIVLWELLTGKLPYARLSPLQAAVGVVQKELRPTIPENAHPGIVELFERCWQQEPSLRPEFSEIIEVLERMSETAIKGERSAKRRNHVPVATITEDV